MNKLKIPAFLLLTCVGHYFLDKLPYTFIQNKKKKKRDQLWKSHYFVFTELKPESAHPAQIQQKQKTYLHSLLMREKKNSFFLSWMWQGCISYSLVRSSYTPSLLIVYLWPFFLFNSFIELSFCQLQPLINELNFFFVFVIVRASINVTASITRPD